MLTDGDEEIVSPSLLVIPECVESNPDLDLGMADWLSDSMVPAPPPPKRLRLTLARSPLRVSNNSGSRFSNPMNSPERAKAAKAAPVVSLEISTTAPLTSPCQLPNMTMRYGLYLLSVCYDCILSRYHIGMNII